MVTNLTEHPTAVEHQLSQCKGGCRVSETLVPAECTFVKGRQSRMVLPTCMRGNSWCDFPVGSAVQIWGQWPLLQDPGRLRSSPNQLYLPRTQTVFQAPPHNAHVVGKGQCACNHLPISFACLDSRLFICYRHMMLTDSVIGERRPENSSI